MKTVLAALALLSATVVSPLVGQGDDEDTRKTLAGLDGVQVWVGSTPDGAQRDGLDTVQLRTDVELKLRQAGIPVLSEQQSLSKVGAPGLALRLDVFRNPGIPLYAFRVKVEVQQVVRLARNPTLIVRAATWSSTGDIGTVGQTTLGSYVRETVRDQMDQFINAYLAANPKR